MEHQPPAVYRSGKSLKSQIAKTEVQQAALALWHLGQAGIVIKGGGLTCYFDPYLSDHILETDPGGIWRRQFAPPLEPSEITHADYVFVTHEHTDHLDPVTLKGISLNSPQAVFVCPAPITGMLRELSIPDERIIGAKVTGEIIRPGIRVNAVACMHEQFFKDADGNHQYLGYVVELNGITFYHAGDTIGFGELAEWLKPHRIDIGCLPINSRDWKRSELGIIGNMGHRDAADLAVRAGIDLLLPIHYDLFPFNADNPAYFVDYLYRTYPGQKFKMMVPGERLIYWKESDAVDGRPAGR
jgi:L-ascorbate metabolism protein UlaG (beta-lactamase superfamily)